MRRSRKQAAAKIEAGKWALCAILAAILMPLSWMAAYQAGFAASAMHPVMPMIFCAAAFFTFAAPFCAWGWIDASDRAARAW